MLRLLAPALLALALAAIPAAAQETGTPEDQAWPDEAPGTRSTNGAAAESAPDVPTEAPPELQHTADILPEFGDTGLYFRVDAGIAASGQASVEPRRVFSGVDIPVTGGFGAAAGLKATEWLRGEVSVDFTPATHVSAACRSCGGRRVGADLSTLLLLAGAYVDMPSFGPVAPYVGAAAGGAATWSENVRFGRKPRAPDADRDFVAAWALAAGASLPLGRATNLDLGYRYVGLGDIDVGGRGRKATLAGLDRHEIRLGVRVGTW